MYGGFGPGSPVKPFLALAALNEGIITPEKTIFSSGEIVVPNPYDPEKPTRYKDWKPGGHGPVNVLYALAESANTYFYAIGGGYKGQPGLGIARIEKYAKIFGLGQQVPFIFAGKQPGQVPSPSWKRKIFGEDWRLGDTYISSIGQYGFLVTPLQLTRSIAAIANRGTLVQPLLVSGTKVNKTVRIDGIADYWYSIIHQGLRLTVTNGTAKTLDLPYVSILAKTGTAQVGNKKDRVHSWSMGFWPQEQPRFAFVFIGERGPKEGTVNASWVARQMFEWMYYERPLYLKGQYPTNLSADNTNVNDTGTAVIHTPASLLIPSETSSALPAIDQTPAP